MKSAKLILTLLILSRLFLGMFICLYFWNSSGILSIKAIPVYIILAGVVYIALQILMRKIGNVSNWWDWVYYGGILSIMIPSIFADNSTISVYEPIADYGTVCLLLAPIADGYLLITKKLERK